MGAFTDAIPATETQEDKAKAETENSGKAAGETAEKARPDFGAGPEQPPVVEL